MSAGSPARLPNIAKYMTSTCLKLGCTPPLQRTLRREGPLARRAGARRLDARVPPDGDLTGAGVVPNDEVLLRIVRAVHNPFTTVPQPRERARELVPTCAVGECD